MTPRHCFLSSLRPVSALVFAKAEVETAEAANNIEKSKVLFIFIKLKLMIYFFGLSVMCGCSVLFTITLIDQSVYLTAYTIFFVKNLCSRLVADIDNEDRCTHRCFSL